MNDDPLSITKDDRVRHGVLGDGVVRFRHGAPFENLVTVQFDREDVGMTRMVRDDLLEKVDG